MLDLRLSQPTIDLLLRDTILYALGWRLSQVNPVTSIAALRALTTRGAGSSARNNDEFVSVTGGPSVKAFRWSAESTAADDGATVIQPTDVSANGRWLAWTSPIYFSTAVGGNSTTLDQITSGPLRRVFIADRDFEDDELLTLVFGATPTVVIEPKGNEPEEATLNTGARYFTNYNYEIHVVVENLRDRREALQGPTLSSDIDPGGYAIDGYLRALLSGVNLNPALDAVMNVRPGRAQIWSSEDAQRFVVMSRLYTVRIYEELLNAPNEYGPINDITAQEHLATMPVTPAPQTTVTPPPAVADPNNYLISGIAVAYPLTGLTQAVTAGSALVAAATVSYAGQNFTFAAWSDTYRDLNPNGTLTFVPVPNDAPAPAVTANALRIGVTRTNGTGVTADAILSAIYTPYGPRWDFGPA